MPLFYLIVIAGLRMNNLMVKIKNSAADIAAKLKEMINREGTDYLSDKPYHVYRELIDSGVADMKTDAAILYFLVNNMLSKVNCNGDSADLSKVIQKECSLNKKMADRLTAIFLSLYTSDNEKEWKNKDMEGLAQFLKEDLTCSWEGHAVWQVDGGSVTCYYNADLVLSPTESASEDDKLVHMLKKNPFTTKDVINDFFKKKIFKFLDDEFEEYCNCDDYYQPVAEDFEIDDRVNEWCKKNGFEVISCEGDGCDSGYEPTLRQSW
jgi:hypothetical protein